MSPCVVPIYPIILVELSPKTIPTMNYTIIELVVIIGLALYLKYFILFWDHADYLGIYKWSNELNYRHGKWFEGF